MHFIQANQIFNGETFLPEQSVLAIHPDGTLQAILNEAEVSQDKIKKYEGILCPGFVNAHCHLELSHMKGLIPEHTGLPNFAKHIIIERNALLSITPLEAQQEADSAMWEKGIVAVGDISNGNASFEVKEKSSIHYHTFIELIGLNPANCSDIFEKGLVLLGELTAKGLKGSLSPHAAYSTSLELIRKIAEYNSFQKLTLSIHNQESQEENRFFMGEPGGFNDLFKFLQLDITWFRAPNMSSLMYYSSELHTTPVMFVHNTYSSAGDITLAQAQNRYWCFCPSANLYIEKTLPDYTLFKSLKSNICIGTDSLASNTTLDVLYECNLILRHSGVFKPEELLRANTFNNAHALGISDSFGSLIPGKNTGLNLIRLNENQLEFIKKIH